MNASRIESNPSGEKLGSSFKSTARKTVIVGVGVTMLGSALAVSAAKAQAVPSPEGPKITICHATASTNNPYTENTVDQNSIFDGKEANGHGLHTGPIFNPDGGKDQPSWGDIIPSFTVGENIYPGLNATSDGLSILKNSCEISTPSPSPTPTVTVTVTAQPSATPTITVTAQPSATPTVTVTAQPSATPTVTVTAQPSATPTITVTAQPSATPTITVTAQPSATPTVTSTETVPGPTVTVVVTPSAVPPVAIAPSVTPSGVPPVAVAPSAGPSSFPPVAIAPVVATIPNAVNAGDGSSESRSISHGILMLMTLTGGGMLLAALKLSTRRRSASSRK